MAVCSWIKIKVALIDKYIEGRRERENKKKKKDWIS